MFSCFTSTGNTDPNVSREHAAVEVAADHIVVTALGVRVGGGRGGGYPQIECKVLQGVEAHNRDPGRF